jgi:hypothetical protein
VPRISAVGVENDLEGCNAAIWACSAAIFAEELDDLPRPGNVSVLLTDPFLTCFELFFCDNGSFVFSV